MGWGDQFCISMPHFVKIRQKLAEIWRVNVHVSKWRPSAVLDLWNSNFWRSGQLRNPSCITMPNFVKIGQTVAGISRFLWFSRRRSPPSWIFKNSKFCQSVPCRRPICFTMPNFIKISQTVAEIWRFNGLRNGGCPPPLIFEIRIFNASSQG